MARSIFGLDIGTSNIKIYCSDRDEILNEKNIIAIAHKKDVFAVGDEAFEMHEKAPGSIRVTFPVKYGVIADFANMQLLVTEFINKMSKGGRIMPADYYIAIPTEITEVEKRAFLELIRDSKIKARKIMIINKPVADAVGSGVDVNSAKGVMVVNIGADTTEISVMSLGGIVISRAVKFGGNKLDEQIISAVRKRYNLVIGAKTAEYIKIKLGSAVPMEEQFVSVYGRDLVTGLPMSQEISSTAVYECMIDFIHSIIDSIKMILERTPPELASDIIDTGIHLTGGSSGIRHLADLINNETELHVVISDNPGESVVRGIKTIIEDPAFAEIAMIPKEKVYD